jgi:hypothetical protein
MAESLTQREQKSQDTPGLAPGTHRPEAGHTFSQPDLIIAATALHHRLTVVTRDTGDYEIARVALLNPWVDEAP